MLDLRFLFSWLNPEFIMTYCYLLLQKALTTTDPDVSIKAKIDSTECF